MSELNKLTKYDAEITAVTEFLNFLQAQERAICHVKGNRYQPVDLSDTQIIHEWLGIDAAKVEQERRQLLKEAKA